MADTSEDKKPDAKSLEEGEMINVSVKQVDGGEIQFKIKRKTKMKKLMDAWCQKKGLNRDKVRFNFDGENIDKIGDATPISLGMEDGDSIDVFVQQTGGWMHWFM